MPWARTEPQSSVVHQERMPSYSGVFSRFAGDGVKEEAKRF
jgi:hypothetical protein